MYTLTIFEFTTLCLFKLGFPTGRDSTKFRDKGTDVSSLSQDKATMGQAQNLATGWAGILRACPILSWDGTRVRKKRK